MARQVTTNPIFPLWDLTAGRSRFLGSEEDIQSRLNHRHQSSRLSSVVLEATAPPVTAHRFTPLSTSLHSTTAVLLLLEKPPHLTRNGPYRDTARLLDRGKKQLARRPAMCRETPTHLRVPLTGTDSGRSSSAGHTAHRTQIPPHPPL